MDFEGALNVEDCYSCSTECR